MNDKEYNFDEMYEEASSILNVDKDLQIPSEKKEYQNPYKLDEGLMKLGYEYDSNGIYIHFNPIYQVIGVENDDKFTTQDNIYLMISRDFDTKKKILLKFRWAKKTSDGYSLSRGFEFNNSLDIGDEKILKDLNKKVSFSGGKHDNPSSEGSYVKFVDDFTSQIIESNCLSILKEVNYDTPEEIDDESSEDTNNDIQSFDDYPEDIQNEAMKLINEGRLFDETQKSVSLTHKGHHTTRDALILCESSIFVGDGIHTWIGGDSGEGKSDLAFAIGKIFPNHYVKILRNISPKHIYYDCENYNDDYNILIFDDLPLNEDMINILKELSDNAKKVKELKTVINGKSETFTLQGKFIVVLTYAKEIDDEELKNRLFNIGVTIIDKSDGNINIKSKIRDNNVIGGNDNPIIERNRLIIQASIHYLIEQDMNIFNPFLSIFNPEDYNNRDVNHLINMVKAKTFFEYSQRRQIQINEDLAITIGSYDDFNYANNIWAKDVEGIKYKLSDKQKLVLKVMEDNGYIMTDDNALTHVEKLSEEYYNTQSRKARDKLLEDKCTKKKLSDLTGIKENTLTNVLDRIEGTSKSLVEHKLIGRYKLNEDDKFSKVIYYKRVIDGESLKSENDSMLTLYFQNTKEKNPSFVLKKIIIDLLYYVKILINERGYIYLKNYCDNHHEILM